MRSNIFYVVAVFVGTLVSVNSLVAQTVDAEYGEIVDNHWGVVAKSNGPCSGGGAACGTQACIDATKDDESNCGVWQCVEYTKRFYREIYRDTTLNITSVGVAQNMFNMDLGLVRFYNGGIVPPHPGDILGFSGTNNIGHASIVMTAEKDYIEVIEQNWSRNNVTRRLGMSVISGNYIIASGSPNYTVQGWLRYPTIGFFGPNADGWHTDGTSKALRLKWNQFSANGSNKLGLPYDNGGGVNVHNWNGLWVQDFLLSNSAKPRFGDGHTMIVYNPVKRAAFLVRDGFRWKYANNNGPLTYGALLMDERSWNNPSLWIPGVPLGNYSRQDFSLGKTMLWSQTTGVLVVDTNILPEFPDFSISSTGGTIPLTLSGYPITKTQVFLTWNGGMELESNDTYVLKQNGSEVVTTTLREATLTNLTPGLTYIFSVALVNAIYGILERSQDITITMPQDNRFELLPEARDSNYVYLTIINERFPDAYALAIYRDNTEIGRTQNFAATQFSDPALAYNTSYIYKVGAVTASSLILGWTPEIMVTTGSPSVSPPQSASPPAPQDPTRPFAIAEFGFLEPAPYVVNGYANAYFNVEILGTQPVTVKRFMVIGYFTYVPTGEIYSRNWKAIEFPDGLTLSPGERYHYQMRNDGQAFPGIPTKGVLKAYTVVSGTVGQFEVTQALEGASSQFQFDVVNAPQPPLLPNLIPVIESVTANPTTDDPVNIQIAIDNRALVGSFPYRVDVLVDGIVESSSLMLEHIAGTIQRITADIGRLPSGLHALQIVADSLGEIQEIREDDNTAQAQVSVTQVLRPNLIISMGIEDKPYYIDENIPITIAVANTGEAKSQPCQIGLGNSPFNQENLGYGYFRSERLLVPEIPAGEILVLQVNFITEVADRFTLWVDVDQASEVSESNEGDNFSSLNISVFDAIRIVLSPVVDTIITRDWNNALGIHEDPLAQTLSVSTRQGISRYARALIGFDFSSIPDFSLIERADLQLSQLSQTEYKDNWFYLNMLGQSFDSSYVTWTKRTSQYNWATSGGYYFGANQSQCFIPSQYVSSWHTQTGPVNKWRVWNVTALVQAVANGAITNRGFILRQYDIANASENQSASFASQDYPDAALRPRLIIRYRTGPKVIFKDNFELGIDARWKVNRTANGSSPIVRLDTTPVSVGILVNSGDQMLYLGDSTSGTYAQATMELDLDLFKYSEATLDFDWATYSLYGPECIRLDIYDGTWHSDVAVYNMQAWQHKSIDLALYNRTQPITIRFRSWMDYPESSDAAYLDNVIVKGR